MGEAEMIGRYHPDKAPVGESEVVGSQGTGGVTRSARRQSAGFALIELAIWAVVLLPVSLAAVSLFGEVYDSAVVRMVPDALLRETPGHLVTWRAGGFGGELAIDASRLGRLVGDLAERGRRELMKQTCTLRNVSALACWWALSIDPLTGIGVGVTSSGCRANGALAGSFSLEGSLQTRMTSVLGVPTSEGRYSPVRILVGVVVGGTFRGLIPRPEDAVLTGSTIGGVREEVSL